MIGERGNSSGSLLPIMAALGVAVLVAISSRGAPVWTELRDGRADRAQLLDRVAELGIVGLFSIAAIAFAVHHLVLARRPGAPPLRRTLLRSMPIGIVSLALLILVALAGTGRAPERRGGGAIQLEWFPGLGIASDPEAQPAAGARMVEPAAEDEPPPPEGSRLNLLLLALLVVVAAIAGAAVWRWRRTAVSPSRLELPLHQSVSIADGIEARETLIGMIEAMLRDPDPRTAIIGAYARLLDSLADRGAPRREYEAPAEHLRRALIRLRVPADPLRTLVELFELARFSTHPLSEPHRQEALRALRSGLQDLEGASEAAGRELQLSTR